MENNIFTISFTKSQLKDILGNREIEVTDQNVEVLVQSMETGSFKEDAKWAIYELIKEHINHLAKKGSFGEHHIPKVYETPKKKNPYTLEELLEYKNKIVKIEYIFESINNKPTIETVSGKMVIHTPRDIAIVNSNGTYFVNIENITNVKTKRA